MFKTKDKFSYFLHRILQNIIFDTRLQALDRIIGIQYISVNIGNELSYNQDKWFSIWFMERGGYRKSGLFDIAITKYAASNRGRDVFESLWIYVDESSITTRT